MRYGIFRWGLVTAALLALAFATPALAAGPPTLELQAPQEVNLGDTITLSAVLRDSQGAAIERATIILWSAASFLGTGGAVRLGEAVTDAQGRATFTYEVRTEGSATLNAYFPGNSRYESAQTSAKIAVKGSGQLYEETAGVQVPGIGVWILVALLGGVWSVYLIVMALLTLIARGGAETSRIMGGHRG
ncbi:MAG: Ig-like domain-containing protein [Chloroflexi bacterium]|nr:Ig-like domain-containing protein [Chloroflexota bacterium]